MENTNRIEVTENLTDATAEQVFRLNSNLKSLVEYCRYLGTRHDKTSLRTKISVLRTFMNEDILVVTTNIKLLKQEAASGNKAVEIQVGRIEDTYVAVINKYKDVQKEILQKAKQRIRSSIKEKSNVLLREFRNEEALIKLQRESQQMFKDLKAEEEMMLNTQQKVFLMHNDIADIQDIMIELNKMVNEQKQSVDEVEQIIMEADSHIKTGTEELEIANITKNSSRLRVVYISVTLVAITMILISLIFLL